MKYFNNKRYKFSTVVKGFNTSIKNFNSLTRNFINVLKNNFYKIFKLPNIRGYSLYKTYKFLKPNNYNISHLKKIKFINSNFFLYHLPTSIIFFLLLYLIIPTFYNYDKTNFEKIICKDKSIVCKINGKTNYTFFPTPRIKINDMEINYATENKNIVSIENTVINLSIKNLLAKEKHKLKKISIKNFKINLDLKNFKKYNKIFKKNNLIPIFFSKGEIIFFEGENYVATINLANSNIIFEEDGIKSKLDGKFLDNNISISLSSKVSDAKQVYTDIILKIPSLKLLTKINLINSEKNENITSGNVLIKKNKNRITAIFAYQNKELIIDKSNLRNEFLDGKIEGKIKLLPYLDFDLDLDLNSINFTKLYRYFLTLEEKDQKNIFKISNKINGKLNIFSEKIYSNYNLIKSLESRVKFYNGNISVEQLLLNLGKLGAADILGTINNDKKVNNFKFESNVFVDNQKKFLGKFGIYNHETISPNLFISGNFDFRNTKMSFYEISNDNKISTDDINYIEKEFNNLMLEDGYKKLFHFPKFKEFVKSISAENN